MKVVMTAWPYRNECNSNRWEAATPSGFLTEAQDL